MPVTVNCAFFTFGMPSDGLVLAQLHQGQGDHRLLINTNVPIGVINDFISNLNNIEHVAENSDISKQLCGALKRVLHVIQVRNDNNAEFYENIAIMVTNCSLNLGAHFSAMSAECNRRRIKLYVVTTITPEFALADYYRTLAHSTGGEYMLLQNAHRILERIILLIINENRNIENELAAPNYNDNINEQNRATDDVGDLPFDHGLSE